ncbi:Fructose-bisphosphate aldolase [subsurface metagenome]
MLTNSKEILQKAQSQGYAVGQFNTSDLEVTKAIVKAAVKMKAPIIIGTSEKAIDYAGLEEIAGIIQTEAEKVNIPLVLHLDHGKSLEIVEKCIQTGYTSVMIDGSHLSFEENIRITKRVASLAHQHKITAEGELGALANREKYQVGISQFLTDPEKAAEFVKKTKVDSLAVAIGNAHGIPLPEEKLDFDRLASIRRLVPVPLVLHGASSTPEKDIKKVIGQGICKINIDTDIRLTFNKSIREFLKTHPSVYDPREILGSVMDAVQKLVEAKIQLFDSAGRGIKG